MTKITIDRSTVEQALEAQKALLSLVEDPCPYDAATTRAAARAAITALEAALAEPVQEPVAWRFEARHIDSAWGAAVSLKHPGPEGVYMRNVVPLYTSPPQRKPLTWAERRALWRDSTFRGNGGQMDWFIEGTRAAERAHGIKEEK